MLDACNILLARLRPARTIEEAFSQVIARRYVQHLLHDNAPADLVEVVAKETGLPERQVLEAIAKRLKFESRITLDPPSQPLLQKVGIDTQALRECIALPQRSLDFRIPYHLAIADPEMVDVSAFTSLGVKIVLAPARVIREGWHAYHRTASAPPPERPKQRVIGVLKRLVTDAQAQGAREIFLGHPAANRYEFLVGSARYSGGFPAFAYDSLVSKCVAENISRLEFLTDTGMLVRVALNHDNSRPVFVVTWETGSKERDDKSTETSEQTAMPEKTVEVTENANSAVVSGAQILLIDDDPRLLYVLSDILEGKGYTIKTAADGKRAITILSNGHRPDLIICDINMPHVDGIQFLKQLRSLQSASPIIMLTSDETAGLEAHLIESGADAFIGKHEEPDVLLAWCKNLILKARARRANRTAISETPETSTQSVIAKHWSSNSDTDAWKPTL